MRILDIPRAERMARVDLHIRRDKMSSYLRRRALRSYDGNMQRAGSSDEGPTQEQRQDFANWVEDVVNAFGEPPKKWSVTRIAEKGGVHRNAIYDWMGMKAVPKRETVARFCKGLGLTYAEPARLLGWNLEPGPAPKDPEGFIRRVKAMAEHEDTPEEKRIILKARIAAAEMHLKNARAEERRFEEIMEGVFDEEKKDTPGH